MLLPGINLAGHCFLHELVDCACQWSGPRLFWSRSLLSVWVLDGDRGHLALANVQTVVKTLPPRLAVSAPMM